MTRAEGLLDGLAGGLRRRVADRARAEMRLADFVFEEGTNGAKGAVDVGAADVGPSDWRYFVARTLAAAGEPGTLDLLERFASGDQTLAGLGRAGVPGLDGPLAAVDRVGGLAAAGLVGRDLETGRVGLTSLGAAVLAFVQEWERRAAARAGSEASEAR